MDEKNTADVLLWLLYFEHQAHTTEVNLHPPEVLSDNWLE